MKTFTMWLENKELNEGFKDIISNIISYATNTVAASAALAVALSGAWIGADPKTTVYSSAITGGGIWYAGQALAAWIKDDDDNDAKIRIIELLKGEAKDGNETAKKLINQLEKDPTVVDNIRKAMKEKSFNI